MFFQLSNLSARALRLTSTTTTYRKVPEMPNEQQVDRTTEVVTMLLHQIVLRKGVPFDVRIPNDETRRAMADLDQGGGERFDGTAEELFERVVGSRK